MISNDQYKRWPVSKIGLVVKDDTDNMLKLLKTKVDSLETNQQELMGEIEAMKTKARHDVSGEQYPHEKCVVQLSPDS